MSSQDVIKSTARKLKYYMEVKRLEDGFDLSGPDKPQRHYPTLKPRPTLLYDGLHDRALKHYFRSPEVKKHLAQMNPRTSHIEREDKVRRDVDKYMAKSQFTGSASHLVRPRATAPRKRRANFKGGPFNLRSKHGPYLTKGEAQRLINAATKMLVASETIPLENQVVEHRKSANVYRVRQNGDREMLPYINSATNTSPKHRPERPKSTYGIRPSRPISGRPKSAMASRPKATEAHPSTKRYGYDSLGRRVRLHNQPQRHYEASESEVEPDDVSEVSDRSMNMLVPVGASSQTPEWFNIKMSRVNLNDDQPLDDEEDDIEDEESSVADSSKADEQDPNLYSIDNTTQTVKETQMQTVENINSKDTQTRRANTIECLTDPYQADMAMQTDPPPISSSTQTVPPPPSVETQTQPPPPCVEVQTMPQLPSVETQTLPPPDTISTQTSTEHPAMGTQTMPEEGTQTVNVISTQTDLPPPEVGTQMTPSASESETEDETFEHLQHGPQLKSGRRTVYEMAIHTGNRLGASTTADIFIILFGERGNTGKIKLKQSREGDKMKFQKGQIDVFRVESFFVGRLECVCIGHDRKELGCGWFCDKVLIREFDNNVTYEFVCNRWLSAQDEDGRTERTLPVTNVIMEVSSSSDSEDGGKRYTSSAVSDTDRHLSEGTAMDHGQASSDYLSGKDNRSEGGSSRSSKRRSRRKDRRGQTTTTTGSDSDSDSGSDRRGKHRRRRKEKSSGSGTSDSESDSESESDEEPQRRGGRRSVSVNNNNSSTEPVAERENYLLGFQAGLKAKEDEMKRQEDEREEEEYQKLEEERLLLQGPSIHECCRSGDLSRAKKLISHTPSIIGTTDERGQTPLHVASSHGRLDIVKWLVVNDASVNELTPTGYSCMHLSAMNGHIHVMKVLAALGMDVDCKTIDEQTPLHLAAMSGHLDCCKWLAANNATLDLMDIMGRIPLDLAEDYQHEDCANFLKSCDRELKRSDSPLTQLRSRSPSVGRDESAKIAEPETDERNKEDDDTLEERTVDGSKTKKEKQAILKRQQSFHQQQKLMNETGMSFLDSIRNSYDNEENAGEQL